MPKVADLPNDVEALKGIILASSAKLEVAEALLISQKLELEKLRFEIACLKRMKYGRSSEQLDQQLTQMQVDRGPGSQSRSEASGSATGTEDARPSARATSL